ncbi:Csu type fimbrial protein [Cognatiluteimonas telluris]|jgi:spore coat protein U-like protein|uniref:Csu type fimbrial protein n=1 Tax=Cognatiluteimonas telluris TaxID=1104775 RepID=UPI0014097585|nr:spore coat U domain-containing protein [Lysobacter telluris]
MHPHSAWLAIGLIACAAMLPGAARAASSASCSVDTSSAQIAFGTYDPLSATPLDGIGTLRIRCDKNNVGATFALDRGGSGSFLPRSMSSGANTLPYNLYKGSPNSGLVFGDGSGGTQTASAVTAPVGGGDFVGEVQVFGRIQAGENAAYGSYSDTIHVDVTF